MSMHDAILKAGKNRLRPILMTSFALIAGMLPVAIGLNEASKQRTSMGVAIIGGLISSTLLTLVVVPAAYGYIERSKRWGNKFFGKMVTSDEQYDAEQAAIAASRAAEEAKHRIAHQGPEVQH
ncbi:MAG: efflux RND transporter permease subunit, partial [Proteobacteria bacterium]